MAKPVVAVGPHPAPFAVAAVEAAGGRVAGSGESADALVWLSVNDPAGLAAVLAAQTRIRWVQLPSAGVEHVALDTLDTSRTWTCGKGAYARPVAEHALALALAGLRRLPDRIRARSWAAPDGASLHGAKVTILGGGGISEQLLRLMRPFEVDATVVRRRPTPVPGADRTVGIDRLGEALTDARVVVVALALTLDTEGIIDRPQLGAMGPDAWLVNVARGRHVHTDALVDALITGAIAGAALDVTDPEPLPDDHPLWTAPNCIITPHTSVPPETVAPLLAERIRVNVARFAAGEPLDGMVDLQAGY